MHVKLPQHFCDEIIEKLRQKTVDHNIYINSKKSKQQELNKLAYKLENASMDYLAKCECDCEGCMFFQNEKCKLLELNKITSQQKLNF